MASSDSSKDSVILASLKSCSCFSMLFTCYAGCLRQRHRRRDGSSMRGLKLQSKGVDAALREIQAETQKRSGVLQPRGQVTKGALTSLDQDSRSNTSAAASTTASNASNGTGGSSSNSYATSGVVVSSTAARSTSSISSPGSTPNADQVQVLHVESDKELQARQREWLEEQTKAYHKDSQSREHRRVDCDDELAVGDPLLEDEVMRPANGWFSCKVCKHVGKTR
eukprot:TRINITY_DN41844_c0_g1_i1.p1 TRINITY_DN41844_c0_g1~~TRINITY_DN41844_c0_g1_i1.p1  ORF type:complete len:224 (+),score=49.17 TRINITY_DN41844_c0_g1_i1:50-721(+)